MSSATQIIHSIPADPLTGAISVPIYQTSTFVQEAPGVNRGYDYARTNNPTRATLEQVVASTKVRHTVIASMGDLLGGLKGGIVNFVVRNVKKMVPAYNLPQAYTFKQALEIGAQRPYSDVPLQSEEIAFLQYTEAGP